MLALPQWNGSNHSPADKLDGQKNQAYLLVDRSLVLAQVLGDLVHDAVRICGIAEHVVGVKLCELQHLLERWPLRCDAKHGRSISAGNGLVRG